MGLNHFQILYVFLVDQSALQFACYTCNDVDDPGNCVETALSAAQETALVPGLELCDGLCYVAKNSGSNGKYRNGTR